MRSYKKNNNKKRIIDDVNKNNKPEFSRLLLSRSIKI